MLFDLHNILNEDVHVALYLEDSGSVLAKNDTLSGNAMIRFVSHWPTVVRLLLHLGLYLAGE